VLVLVTGSFYYASSSAVGTRPQSVSVAQTQTAPYCVYQYQFLIVNVQVNPSSTEAGGETALSFSFSGLSASTQAKFVVSYVVADPASALKQALAAAQSQVDMYNRTGDIDTLSQAKMLAAQNRTEEALAILSKMVENGQFISYADYQQFTKEKASAQDELASAKAAQEKLGAENLTDASSQLSTLTFKLESAIASAESDAGSKGYTAGLATLRKAVADFRSSLASLAWNSATAAQEEYANARKVVQTPGLGDLSAAESKISDSKRAYSSGDHLNSILLSSAAKASLLQLQGLGAGGEAQSLADAAQARSDFAGLLSATNSLLTEYSRQYSVLAAQSKKQLAITPSDAQQKIDAAQKSLDSSSKASLSPLQQAQAAKSDAATTANTMQQPSAPAVLEPEVRQARAADGAAAAALSGAWDIRALESRAGLLKSQLRQLAADPAGGVSVQVMELLSSPRFR